jgi:hypothetical protein
MIPARHRLRRTRPLSCVLTMMLSMLFVMLFSTPVVADDWEDEDGVSFFFEGSSYVSAGYNYVVDDFPSKIGTGKTGKGTYTIDSNVKTAEGFNLIFGKRVWKYLAVETQFEYANGFFDSSAIKGDNELEVYTTTLNAKTFPLHDFLNGFNEGRLQPHLLIGTGFMATKNLDIKTSAAMAFRFGGGIDYFVYDRWAVHLKTAYVLPVRLLKGLRFTTTSIGLTFQLE